MTTSNFRWCGIGFLFLAIAVGDAGFAAAQADPGGTSLIASAPKRKRCLAQGATSREESQVPSGSKTKRQIRFVVPVSRLRVV